MKPRPLISIAVLSLLLLALQAVSLGVGPTSISLMRLLEHGTGGTPLTDMQWTILWDLRCPRILLAGFVGAGLGVAGTGYQGLFRNPLADPFVIGASSGAALGVSLAVVGGLHFSFWFVDSNALLALIGSLGAVSIVYAIASFGKEVPVLSLLLAGVTVSSFAGALVSLLMFLNDNKVVTIFHWILGSFSDKGWPTLQASVPILIVGMLGLWLCSRTLDALSFGDDSAQSLGLSLKMYRRWVVLAASLTTAAAVSAAGTIGFVGLIAPHVARYLVGARHALVIPTSGLVGAIMLVLADDLARSLAEPAELPVGVVTALMGSPFFLILLRRRQRNLGAPS